MSCPKQLSLYRAFYRPAQTASTSKTNRNPTDSIKRQARKEAWYSDDFNPFRKTASRSSAWRPSEANDGGVTGHSFPYRARPLQEYEETAIERQDGPGPEEKARQRFLSKFNKRNHPAEDLESDDGRRPRLKHVPFTVRNQLAATIFNHWVRALLLLTPVGLAVHYAHLNATTDFLVNFFAVLPLTDMFGQSLVELKTWSQDPRSEWIAYVIFGYEKSEKIP